MLCFLLILAMGILACEQYKETIILKEANKAYNDEKYLDAIEKYQQLTGNPRYEKTAWLHIGYSHLSMLRSALSEEEAAENSEKAVAAFQKYLELEPSDTTVEDYIFNTYMDSGDYEKVLGFLMGKHNEDPTDIRAVQLIIQAYEDQGMVPEAVEWYKKRIELNPEDPDGYYAFAVFYWRNSFYNQRLDVNLRAQMVDDGIEYCKKAVELSPEFADAYTYWNLLLREKANKYTKSKREQEKILEEAKVLQEKGREIRMSQQTEEEKQAAANAEGEPGDTAETTEEGLSMDESGIEPSPDENATESTE